MKYYSASLLVLLSLFTFSTPARAEIDVATIFGHIFSPQLEKIKGETEIKKEALRQQAAIRIEELRQQTALQQARIAAEGNRGSSNVYTATQTTSAKNNANPDRGF